MRWNSSCPPVWANGGSGWAGVLHVRGRRSGRRSSCRPAPGPGRRSRCRHPWHPAPCAGGPACRRCRPRRWWARRCRKGSSTVSTCRRRCRRRSRAPHVDRATAKRPRVQQPPRNCARCSAPQEPVCPASAETAFMRPPSPKLQIFACHFWCSKCGTLVPNTEQ